MIVPAISHPTLAISCCIPHAARCQHPIPSCPAAPLRARGIAAVGYGDLSPSSDLSKAFTIGYILMGLSLVATCLGVLIGEVQGAAEASQAAKAKAAAKAGHEAVAAFNRQRHIATVVGSLVTVVGLLSLGAALVSYSEGWGALDSFYWAVVTVSSVGYGDLVVDEDHTATIVFATAYMLVAVGGCAVALGNFGSVIMEIESDAKVDRFVARGVTEGMISEMDDEKCGSVGRAQFLAYMLVAMGKVEQKDCDKVNAMFDAVGTSRGHIFPRLLGGDMKLRPRRGCAQLPSSQLPSPCSLFPCRSLFFPPPPLSLAQLDADGSGSLDLEDVRAFNERRRSHSLTKSKPNPSAAVEYSKRRSTFGSGSSFGQLQKPLLDAA